MSKWRQRIDKFLNFSVPLPIVIFIVGVATLHYNRSQSNLENERIRVEGLVRVVDAVDSALFQNDSTLTRWQRHGRWLFTNDDSLPAEIVDLLKEARK